MARSRLSRHFFIKDDNFTANNKIPKACQESGSLGRGREGWICAACQPLGEGPGRLLRL